MSQLLLESWRMFPDTYAEKLSGGRWKAYAWIKYLTEKIYPSLIKGGGRFIVTVPPRHGKSEYLSAWLPTWYLDSFPLKRVILCSYAHDFAARWGRKVRNNLESLPVRVKVDQESRAANRFDTALNLGRPERGGMITAGVGGQITGQGGDLNIIDDPIKNWADAMNENVRNAQKEWFKTVFRTRFEPNATAIILQTRWHQDDLSGWLIKGDDPDLGEFKDKWTVINLPAIAEEDDPLGRNPGDALCPERYSENDLRFLKSSVGSMGWAALYQQRPYIVEGSLFKRSWWKYWDALPEKLEIVQFWDTAQKAGISNDYSICATWARAADGFYLLDLWRGKVEAPELEATAIRNFEKWKPMAVVIEDKSSGSSLIQNLRRKTTLPVIAFDPGQRDKEVRAIAATPTVEAGKCFLPRRASWLPDFLAEHERFPNDVHDDMVDTTSTMVEYFNRRSANGPRLRSL